MHADLLSDAIGKAEADAIGKAKALADRIDAKFAHGDAVEFSLGSTRLGLTSLGLIYVFLNDINELNEIVSSLVQCCSDKPDVWKERVAEINGRSGDLSLLDHAFMHFMHDSRHQ